MARKGTLLMALAVWAGSVLAVPVPENLVADGIPAVPDAVARKVGPYLESRAASFWSWHPTKRKMIIGTRFAETMQIHELSQPGGARKQLTFLPEPVAGATYRPKTGAFLVFQQDVGGGEFFQNFRFDPQDGRVTLITDGKSRNSGGPWSNSGHWIAYSSTRRNGRDTDLYVANPVAPETDRIVKQLEGGGWQVTDWSPDDTKLLVLEYISINESRAHLFELRSGKMERITPHETEKVSYSGGKFSKDGKSIFLTTDRGAEFMRLARFDMGSRSFKTLTENIKWNIEEFDVSSDGKVIAAVSNEDGASVLRFIDAQSGRELGKPKLPAGVISGVEWHEQNQEVAFSLASAKSPSDVYSVSLKGKIERWTESETGGLNPEKFVEPRLAKFKSFDGLQVSAFVYEPDGARFPGKRPSLIVIHGGPESQSRPGFMGRYNYLLNELGIAIVVPNVRGSAGYGKTFLTLDNGMKREDSVRDIGALIDWMRGQEVFDGGRIAVTGGSYGGYMTLASMVHYSDRLRCGIDVVGISDFVTFLQNTQDYRRDLRRVEYGDERDPAMRAFLEKIAPARNVAKITKPMMIVQGKNDPRVPLSESEQMVKALRSNNRAVWYLVGNDEGHGFKKKRNVDYQFYATLLFLQEHLLK